MIRNLAVGLVLTCASAAQAFAQVPINSLQRRVEGFYEQVSPTRWNEYRITGFAQPLNAGGAGVKPRYYLLPAFSLKPTGVKYMDEQGIFFTPANCASRPIRSISFEIEQRASLPNQVQKIAVGAAFLGENPEFFYPTWPVNQYGVPAMWQPGATLPGISDAVRSLHSSYQNMVNAQNAYVAEYAKYDVSFATLNELALDLWVDGERVSTTDYPGSSVNSDGAPLKLTMPRPDTVVCNLIRQGEFEIRARYKFNDTATSTINARFNTETSIRSFLKETQTATTKSRNSGWKVLGIGSRRSKMKSALDQTLVSNTDVGVIQGTTVVTFDADDTMIADFERIFFPQISRDRALENHQAAAIEADAAGKTELAAAHRAYANSLTDGREELETDAVGAAAALNEGDYATFVAKGVRFSENSTSRTDTFRRTADLSMRTEEMRAWDQSKTITRQRQSITPISVVTERATIATLGGVEGAPYTFPFVTSTYPFRVENRSGFLLAAVVPGSPLALGGLQAGMIITEMARAPIRTKSDFLEVLNGQSPGERVEIKTLRFTGSDGYSGPLARGAEDLQFVTVGERPVRASR